MKRTTRGRRSTNSDSGKNVDIKIKHWKLRLVFVILFAINGKLPMANAVVGIGGGVAAWL